ncbi:hypothetical protein ACIRSS_11985 [Amycolatopsis sp. NPDC101161]|uniref:hypothetical protein n=1 Tax=Amycolatopsis sp. NPDC101161 TaxID=3363940 RepID=UPI00381B295B
MSSKQHRPCALVAGDLPITTVPRTTVLVIMVSLLLSAHLLGDSHEAVLLLLLACAGMPAGLSVNRPPVLNLRFRKFRLGLEAVGDI